MLAKYAALEILVKFARDMGRGTLVVDLDVLDYALTKRTVQEFMSLHRIVKWGLTNNKRNMIVETKTLLDLLCIDPKPDDFAVKQLKNNSQEPIGQALIDKIYGCSSGKPVVIIQPYMNLSGVYAVDVKVNGEILQHPMSGEWVPLLLKQLTEALGAEAEIQPLIEVE